jgi:hypothetical protein
MEPSQEFRTTFSGLIPKFVTINRNNLFTLFYYKIYQTIDQCMIMMLHCVNAYNYNI